MMDTELDIINRIVNILPRSKRHLNNFFESDAEVLDFCNKNLLFSIDEFSREDFFNEKDAYSLGWNLCYCTLSDIFASGGIPIFYAHSISLESPLWDKDYIENLSNGIKDVLKECNTGFIGGDLGHSKNWSYTGVVIGETHKPISRKGVHKGDTIYTSGYIGQGNVMAAIQMITPHILRSENDKNKFVIRLKESQLISNYASSCIDTSDGLINALNTVARLNNTGYLVESIPYLPNALKIMSQLNLPKELLFLGECGEYELLFTIPRDIEQQFKKEAQNKNFHFTPIGYVTDKNQKEFKTTHGIKSLADFNLNARSFANQTDYINHLLSYANKMTVNNRITT